MASELTLGTEWYRYGHWSSMVSLYKGRLFLFVTYIPRDNTELAKGYMAPLGEWPGEELTEQDRQEIVSRADNWTWANASDFREVYDRAILGHQGDTNG